MSKLTLAHLKEVLDYEPLSGDFIWRYRPDARKEWNTKYAGTVAGTIDGRGYVSICIDSKLYRGHMLAWFWLTGLWPTKEIDHRNLDRTDNWCGNLREATTSQNRWNTGIPKHNTSGFKGVSRSRDKWQAQIKINGKQTPLGTFETPELASEFYRLVADMLHGGFARHV